MAAHPGNGPKTELALLRYSKIAKRMVDSERAAMNRALVNVVTDVVRSNLPK